MDSLLINPLKGYIKSGITLIEDSTKKLIENENHKFEAYINILKNQLLQINQIQHTNEVLEKEIARITEQLSLRELEIESKEEKIFELEKKTDNSIKNEKKYEIELNKLIKEKESLIQELSNMRNDLENIKNEQNILINNGRKRNLDNSQDLSTNNNNNNNNDNNNNLSIKKKGRLRRLHNEDYTDEKKNINNDIDMLLDNNDMHVDNGINNNPLKDILNKTNLGKLKKPLLKNRIIKAAQALNPNNNIIELKSLEEETSNSKKIKKTDLKKDTNKKSGKKISKLAKIAKIPHYSENVLNSMKVIELKDVCNKLQLEINNRMRKSELIQTILSFQDE